MSEKEVKKALGGVRPAEEIYKSFTKMAKDQEITQTRLFEEMFKYYLIDQEKEKRENVLSFDSQISLISRSFYDMLSQVKAIAMTAQDKLLVEITSSKEKDTQIEAYKTQNEEFSLTMAEDKKEYEKQLEEANNRYKALEDKYHTATERYLELQEELENSIAAKEDLLKTIEELKPYEKYLLELKQDLGVKERKITKLEDQLLRYQDTLNTIDELKKSEIEALKNSQYETIKQKDILIEDQSKEISLLKENLLKANEKIKEEIKEQEEKIRNQIIAELKLSFAEEKMAMMEEKAKLLEEINKLRQEKN